MATKAATRKKPTTTKKTAAKRAPAKKAPVKRTTTAGKSKASYAKMESFKLYKSPDKFMSIGITKQTVFWIILLVVIAVFQAWILALEYSLLDTLNSIQSY